MEREVNGQIDQFFEVYRMIREINIVDDMVSLRGGDELNLSDSSSNDDDRTEIVDNIIYSIPLELTKFLTHVVKGEQSQAEKMLKKNRHLALAPGTITDHTERTFNNITGFQYAVWALDWHMWRMIQKYLPKEAAQSQALGFTTGPWVKQHGVQTNWQNLLDAYKYYLDNYSNLFKASKWTELHNIWLKQIGGSQKLLPMHVFHEYCHPDRPFDPVPDFTKGSLPRSLPDWFSLDKIASDYSIYRTAALRPKMWRDVMHKPVVKALYHYTCDQNALTQLANTRSQQRIQLVTELTNST